MNNETTQKMTRNYIWLTFLIVVGGALSAFLATNTFDATVSLSGILCVGLIAIGRREGYLIGLYNSLSYSIISYNNALFGEVYLNLLFFLPTGILGFVMWSRHMRQSKTVEMRQLNRAQRLVVVVICIAFSFGLGHLLKQNDQQNTPFIDATTNVLSVVATFLMMWRYKEQWLLYIIINIITIVMWYIRFKAGGEAGDLMILMWSLFLLNAIYGYWNWHEGAKRNSFKETTQFT